MQDVAGVCPMLWVFVEGVAVISGRRLRRASGKDFGYDVVAWRQYVQTGDAGVDSPTVVDRVRDLF